ncbi:MAG: patatin-like phospholipase family protein [Candidatus Baltobacteraceae bacterium]
MKRKSFVGLAASAAALPAVPARAQLPGISARRGRKALVLIGGANRGAYQAGAIQALTQIQGIADGQPLDFDMICGTSIGALNGYMVATGQYETLAKLWRGGIASRNVFRLKPEFDAIDDHTSGLLNRVVAAYRLSSGLVRNVTGVLDPAPLRAMLAEYVDPATPTLLPFYISATNITRRANQLFVRRATTPAGQAKQAVNDALIASSNENVRGVDDALLRDVLFASAAIPILLDPIWIPREHDPQKSDAYVDGGVTQNVPIDIAMICTDELYVTLLSPPYAEVDEEYDSALEIGLGMFATMQERILAYQVRLAYALSKTHLPFTPYVIRPAHDLPGHGADFDNQADLEKMWQLGFQDMVRGWASFVPPPDLPLGAAF